MSDQTIFETLVELMRARGSDLGEKLRAYRVRPEGGDTRFVVSNSPGQAAQVLCEVETVSQKEQLAALKELVAEKR